MTQDDIQSLISVLIEKGMELETELSIIKAKSKVVERSIKHLKKRLKKESE